jgi:hypothetical protein
MKCNLFESKSDNYLWHVIYLIMAISMGQSITISRYTLKNPTIFNTNMQNAKQSYMCEK